MLFCIIEINPNTGVRLDDDGEEWNDTEIDNWIAHQDGNADETRIIDDYRCYRIGNQWFRPSSVSD